MTTIRFESNFKNSRPLNWPFSHLFFIKFSQIFFLLEIFDDVCRKLFVDIAKISKVSSVDCGLYHIRNGISFFKCLTQTPVFNFRIVNFINDLSYKVNNKSLFDTSLGDFPFDQFLRQFSVKTNCCSLAANFSPWSSMNKFTICYKDWIALSANAAFVSLLIE